MADDILANPLDYYLAPECEVFTGALVAKVEALRARLYPDLPATPEQFDEAYRHAVAATDSDIPDLVWSVIREEWECEFAEEPPGVRLVEDEVEKDSP